MIYNRRPSLIPPAANPPKPESVSNNAGDPAEAARDVAPADVNPADHAGAPVANCYTRKTPVTSALLEYFRDQSPPSDQPVIEPLRGDDDFARFINAMQRRNEAGEISAMGFVWFSETKNVISALVTGWISSRRRDADLARLITEIEHIRDFRKTLRVARRRGNVIEEGVRDWTRGKLADLRREYERGSIEGICAVVYGVDGATRLFSKSTLSIPKTLMALDCLRGLPSYNYNSSRGGFITSQSSRFNDANPDHESSDDAA